jgi:lysyl-tRNA synthetase class I
MANDTTYLYLEGLQRLATEVNGNEKIYMGIRPYALHAGNILSIVVYPYLLCEAVKARGIEPGFQLIISINDWEQDQLVGSDIYKYPFDTKPLHTTIAHTYEPSGVRSVDFWQPHIEHEINKIKRDFPKVTIRAIRNSTLHSHPAMREAIYNTIEHYEEHKKILLRSSHQLTLNESMRFSNALCSQCHNANTNTSLSRDNRLHTVCSNCKLEEDRAFEECDFWLYHKQLFAPRLAILNFQITISGADHYLEGDSYARKALYEYIYKKPMPSIKMAFTPLLLAEDGAKMSKSRKNDVYMSFEDILPHARSSTLPSLSLTS